jgi:hypothetical protein
VILLPQHPSRWNYRCLPPCLTPLLIFSFLFSLIFSSLFFFCRTNVWTQGFMLPKQALYMNTLYFHSPSLLSSFSVFVEFCYTVFLCMEHTSILFTYQCPFPSTSPSHWFPQTVPNYIHVPLSS